VHADAAGAGGRAEGRKQNKTRQQEATHFDASAKKHPIKG